MSALPSGFEALEAFVGQWALDGVNERAAMRGNSSDAERQAFYAAALPLVPSALDLLDAKPFDAYEAADQRLMFLCLSFAHVSLAVEMQADDEDKHTPNREAMLITRATADR